MSPFALALDRTKTVANTGTLLRSAFNFRCSAIYTIGRRYKTEPSDCTHTTLHVPLIHCRDWADFHEHRPQEWQLVAVELCSGAVPLPNFTHPRSAIYLLGPEDGSLTVEALKGCGKHIVEIPSMRCLNLAVAGSIVMYDRQAKRRDESVVPLRCRTGGTADDVLTEEAAK